MPTGADTCRRFVVPKLQAAGWDNEPYSIAEQRTITDGRIVPVGKSFTRRPSKRVDYLLRYRRDFNSNGPDINERIVWLDHLCDVITVLTE
jgi:type I restriction enzyme, R subunit